MYKNNFNVSLLNHEFDYENNRFHEYQALILYILLNFLEFTEIFSHTWKY